jgi:hypothetical protein
VFNRAYEKDREHLFLDTVCHPSVGDGQAISSFFVRASVYFAFFGDDFKSAVSVDEQNPGDKASQSTEREVIANNEASTTFLDRSSREQISSSIAAAEPSYIILDNNVEHRLETSNATTVLVSSGDETMDVSSM